MNAHDRAVAELVDMGFSADQSAIALATTDSGLDVQAAVGWILNQAHAQTKQRTQDPSRERSRRRPDEPEERSRRGNSRPSAREGRDSESVPAWMRDEDARSRSGQRRQDGQKQEKDVTQVASEIGSTLFKSANSLWKQGRKQVQKAVADFQQDGGDSSVPKWMRDAQAAEAAAAAPISSISQRPDAGATDEAMMLEGGGRPTKPTRQAEQRPRHDELPVRPRREQERPDRMASQSPAQRQSTPSYDKRPAARLTRQEVEEQSAQAYVSPARRKKATPSTFEETSPSTTIGSSIGGNLECVRTVSKEAGVQIAGEVQAGQGNIDSLLKVQALSPLRTARLLSEARVKHVGIRRGIVGRQALLVGGSRS